MLELILEIAFPSRKFLENEGPCPQKFYSNQVSQPVLPRLLAVDYCYSCQTVAELELQQHPIPDS